MAFRTQPDNIRNRDRHWDRQTWRRRGEGERAAWGAGADEGFDVGTVVVFVRMGGEWKGVGGGEAEAGGCCLFAEDGDSVGFVLLGFRW